MADKTPQPLNVGELKALLTALIKEGKVTPKTPVAMYSDEEGNQIHRLYFFALDFDGEWNADFTKKTRAKDAKDYLILVPAGEELDL